MRRLLIVTICLALVAGACNGESDEPGPDAARVTTSPATTSPTTTSPTTTSPVTTTPVTTSQPGDRGGITIDPSLVAAPVDVITATALVGRIFDGDSMELDLGGATTEVRMIGINAPEGSECHGAASRRTLTSVVESAGFAVQVELGEEETDQFGRRLVYLSAEGVDLNALMVATGNALAIQTGHDREDRYLDLQESAFADGAGMWALEACGPARVADGAVRIAEVVADPPGPDDERLVDEIVEIRNESSETVDVGNWVLRDESTANRYVFPRGTVFRPGATLTVHVGCGEDAAGHLYWCNTTPVWSNGGDSVVLQDDAGNVVDLLVYRG